MFFRRFVFLILLLISTNAISQNCNNLGFEDGSFTNWEGWVGQATGMLAPTVPVMIAQGFSASQHQIVSTGTDFWSGISMVSPTGGTYSAQLGNSQPGGQAEQLRQTFLVDSNNAVYMYQYAVVFEDPGHIGRPLFEIKMYDQNDSLIPCGQYLVRADQGIPGFVSTTVSSISGVRYIVYKDWTDIAVNLSDFIGDSITVEFTTADCNAGQHFGYAYIDGTCDEFEIESNESCDGTVVLSAPPGFQSYQWTNGMFGQTITVNNPIPGDSVTVYLTPVMGCPTTLTYHFDSIPELESDFGFTEACIGEVIQFTDSSYANPDPIVSWGWSFGDGVVGTDQDPTHTYSAPGTYDVTLTVELISGCMDSITKQINICSLFDSVDFLFDTVCAENEVQFIDVSLPHSQFGNIVTRTWDMGNGTILTQDSILSYTYFSPGTYNVSLIVGYQSGDSDTVTHSVTVNPIPASNFSFNQVCIGVPTDFADVSSISAGSIVRYSWELGDGTTSSGQSYSHTFDQEGLYVVIHEVESDMGCIDSSIYEVSVHSMPEGEIVTRELNTCSPLDVEFTYNCSSDTQFILVDTALVTFDDLYNKVTDYLDANTEYVILVSGDYNVWGDSDKLLDAGFNVTYSGSSVVNAGFPASAPYDYLRPIPDIYNSSHIYSYRFNGSNAPMTISFADPNYSDNTGKLHLSIYQVALPCQNEVTSWDFGNGMYGNGNIDSTTYTTSGQVGVSVTIEDTLTSCSVVLVDTISVIGNPIADFSFSDVCEKENVQFTDESIGLNSSGNTWAWEFGDGNGSIAQNPSNLYQNSGQFSVKLLVENASGCVDSIEKQIQVHPTPVAQFSSSSLCAGDSIQFTDESASNSGVSQWQWQFGNSTSSNLQNPETVYTNGGFYNVELMVTDGNGCVHDTSEVIEVGYIPDVSFTPNIACFGDTTWFIDHTTVQGSTISDWYWLFGDDQSTSTLESPGHLYSSFGTFTVSLVATSAFGCQSAHTQNITVVGPPVASFTSDPVCENEEVLFIDQSVSDYGVIDQWEWTFPSEQSFSQNPTILASSTGQMDVSLKVTSEYGCSDSINRTVYINPNPEVDFFADSTEGCEPFSVNFNSLSTLSSGNISTYTWTFGDGDTVTSESSISHTYEWSGLFDVTLTVVSDSGCLGSRKINNYIKVVEPPIANFSVSDHVLSEYDPVVYFNDSSVNGTTWFWEFGDDSTSSMVNPIHEYANYGDYTVVLWVENSLGCIDSTSEVISITPEFSFFVPNAFTPNGDGYNDRFNGKGVNVLEYEMYIFDRWGEQIYFVGSLEDSWDGTFKDTGKEVKQDVYVYKIKLKDVNMNRHDYHGKVVLLR